MMHNSQHHLKATPPSRSHRYRYIRVYTRAIHAHTTAHPRTHTRTHTHTRTQTHTHAYTYTHAHTRTHTHTPILVKRNGVLNVCLHFNRMTFACVFNDIRGNMRRTVANYFLRFDVHCSLFVMSMTRMGVRWSSVTTKLICLMKMDKQL